MTTINRDELVGRLAQAGGDASQIRTILAEALDKRVTHVNFLLDESGSMAGGMAEALQAGFNDYLSGLRADSAEYTMTAAKFNDASGLRYTKLATRQPLEAVPELTSENYRPYGGTPLYDALAKMLDETDVPDGTPVLTVIYTDGQENCSTLYSAESINALIKQAEARGWTFIYMGASREAWQNERMFHGTISAANSYRSSGARGTRSASAGALGSTIAYAAMADHSTARTVVTDESKAAVAENSD